MLCFTSLGGRTSDKYLKENSGFLSNIIPGDVVADIAVKESIEVLGGRLEIPAFTTGKDQLHPIDLEKTRELARVRIHVERIIVVLENKFQICKGPIPISMMARTIYQSVSCYCTTMMN